MSTRIKVNYDDVPSGVKVYDHENADVSIFIKSNSALISPLWNNSDVWVDFEEIVSALVKIEVEKYNEKSIICEHRVNTIRAHDDSCFGCKKHDAYVMVSYTSEESPEVTDLFLLKEEAENLFQSLGEALLRNQDE